MMGVEKKDHILITRTEEGRWHVRIGGVDMGMSYQYPWSALECALNGSLTGRPLVNAQEIEVAVSGECSSKSTREEYFRGR